MWEAATRREGRATPTTSGQAPSQRHSGKNACVSKAGWKPALRKRNRGILRAGQAGPQNDRNEAGEKEEEMSKEKEEGPPKPVDAEKLWKDIEDRMVPLLRVSMIERAAYYNLVRHTRLEGKKRLRFSIQ